MVDWSVIIISLVAFGAALLTFFSGFGLGTLLTPVLMLFFPVEQAIALSGIVHFGNNLFKVGLTRRNVNWPVVWRFGLPAIVAAFAGAWLLHALSQQPPMFTFHLWGQERGAYVVKWVLAFLLLVFALFDILPFLKKLSFKKDKLVAGGLISGFFGGLSGHQGALRSAFLVRTGMTKEMFIGTTVIISTMVDITRLSVYASAFSWSLLRSEWVLLLCAVLSAMFGAYLGLRLLKKITIDTLQWIVSIFLGLLSLALFLDII